MRRSPLAAGSALALASAVAFGATTPLVQRFGRGVGPFTTAALLYGGAALVAALPRGRRDAPLRRSDAPRVVAVALLGAVAAPMALAWGLQHTSGVAASLLLNLEALFTVLLARAIWREPIGPRVGAAVAAMVAGGALLVLDVRSASVVAGWGALAVVGATLGWAGDNVLGRPLADRDPTHVVLAKGALGAALSLALARALGESWPAWEAAAALAACGAVGYGMSLRLYLRAQRVVGAARTGSVFAVAPFLGAATAWAMGERPGGLGTLGAGALCALGVWLHLTESHEHTHAHGAVEHEHAHRHDDGHHDHPHDPAHDVPPSGEHSHAHRHDPVTHGHPHAPDLHHRHGH
ncbi:MAG TPA: DMT family transporter [Polyangiaceae bacterium]